MSDQEKKILDTISNALPEMNDFDRGYLLGMAEQIAKDKKEKEKTEEKKTG